MNNKIIIGIVIAVIIIGGGAYLLMKNNTSQMSMQNMPTQTQTNSTSGSKVTGKNAVTIQNFAFSPATLTVKAGDKVIT